MKTIIGCATYPGDSYIGGCQGLHQMPRAAPKGAGGRYCGQEKFSAPIVMQVTEINAR